MSEKLLWSGPLGQAAAIAFSPKGNELLVAVSNPNRIVRLAVSVVAGGWKARSVAWPSLACRHRAVRPIHRPSTTLCQPV